ncbi:Uncharacterised protein [Candidatus Gugararchaeum adminiculabundum]|nr:Uncharacterised protein [Candidatus Gugararchaeum adminiculabundum]
MKKQTGRKAEWQARQKGKDVHLVSERSKEKRMHHLNQEESKK